MSGLLPIVEVLSASSAKTADFDTGLRVNPGYRGVLLIVDATAEASTAEVTPKILAYDPASAAYYAYWTAAAAISATGDYTYLLYPGATDGNNTEVDGCPLPAQYKILMDAADADALTYSLTAHFLP